MAIIYSYPGKSTPAGQDVLVITDSEQTAPNKNRTKSLTIDNLASYVISSTGAITGSGTLNTMPIFTGTNTIGDSFMTYNPTSQFFVISKRLQVDSDLSVFGRGAFSGPYLRSSCPLEVLNVLQDGNSSPGTAGQVLSSTVTGVEWISPSSGTVTGTGTPDSLTVFKTASEIYTPVNTTAIAGKSFLQRISQTDATIELGASTSFTDLNEGLEIYPNTTHFTTRVTPWLEIFAYEDPAANPLNTYDAAYDGSALVVGKSNTIGDASSSNLAIVGFNNVLKGNKMFVVGQTNTINGTGNTGSMAVGVSNSIATTGTIKNSLIAGQNLGVPIGITATIDTSFITGRGNAAQGNIFRSIVGGDDNDANNIQNSFISGFQNQIVNAINSSIIAGTSNTIGSINTSSNNHNFVAGENNNLGTYSGSTNNKNSFALGRGNAVTGLIGGAIGSGNIVYSDTSAGSSYAIGQNNTLGSPSVRVRNAVAIGTQNELNNNYEIQIGRGLDSVTTSGNNHVLIGRNNDQNTDYDLSSINCSLVVGASTTGAATDRRNGLVITNKTGSSNEGNVILPGVGKYRNYVDEAAAKTGGVPLYGLYHTDGVVHIVYTP